MELELNLLKSSPSTLSSSSPTSTDPDAPLDSLVSSLRSKYITQADTHQRQLTELRDRDRQLTDQLRLALLEKERAALDMARITGELDEVRAKERERRGEALWLQRRVEEVEAESKAKLGAAEARNAALSDEVRALCVGHQSHLDIHSSSLREAEEREAALQLRVKQLQGRVEALEVRELELSHEIKALPYHEMREEVERLKSVEREVRGRVRELEMAVEERDERVRVVERQRAGVVDENAGLLHRLHVWEEEVRARDTELGLHAQGRAKWSEELVRGRGEAKERGEEVEVLRDRLARAKAQAKAEQEQRLTLAHTLKEWEASIATLHGQHAALTSTHAGVVAAHRTVVVECELLQGEVGGLRGEVGRLEGRLKEVEEERRALQVRLQRMEGEAEVVQAVAGLNVEEMRGVMGGWERMAEAWKGVVGKLDKREGDREREGVGEVNAAGLDSARSAISEVYPSPRARGRGKGGREHREEKMQAEVAGGQVRGGGSSVRSRSASSSSSSSGSSEGSEGGSESGSESEWGESRPSSAGGGGVRPGSARSSASDVSASSYSTTSTAASQARYRDKERERNGRDGNRAGSGGSSRRASGR